MPSSVGSSIDELVARKRVQSYGHCSVVTIPGWSTLSEAKRRAICTKLQTEQQTAAPLDVEALENALRNLPQRSPTLTPTPPPDPPEVQLALSSELENQARRELSEDGCPPCYPTHLGFPLLNVPYEYEGIVSYWNSLPGTGGSVLHAQLSNWKCFRNYQKRIRRHRLLRNSFPIYQNEVRDRRRRHGVEGDGCIRSDPEEQTGLDHWIEFQNYHLAIYESLQKGIQKDAERLRVAKKQSEESGVSGVRGAEDVKTFEYRLSYGERRLRQHENLLRWIEQQRVTMIMEQTTSVHDIEGNDDQDQVKNFGIKATAINFRPSGCKRKRKAESDLDSVQPPLSKQPCRKPTDSWPSKRDIPPAAETAIADSIAFQRRSSRTSKLKEKKARYERKSMAICPFRPQKVSKVVKNSIKPSVSAHPILRSSSRLHARAKKKSGDRVRVKPRRQVQRSAPGLVKTRSGRQSKRPDKFCPGKLA